MIVRELIEHLYRIKDQESEVIINVVDSFSSHGHDAILDIDTLNKGLWTGIITNKDTREVRLTAHLKGKKTFEGDVKVAKITFR